MLRSSRGTSSIYRQNGSQIPEYGIQEKTVHHPALCLRDRRLHLKTTKGVIPVLLLYIHFFIAKAHLRPSNLEEAPAKTTKEG